ncbi:MAG: phosphotransferase [Ardenticatenaceae bacterium]|nr:phosphotransferase [Ardenticatenaceae bacterium]MCB8990749.1 phosphotransferase [Ardenticatenaceae bacterium]MCB9003236.1 phosphotransferase [Ardenticatenaceae bacterium]
MDTSLGQLIAEGRTAEVYALDEDRVIKLFYDWCPSPWIQQEIEIANFIASMPIPSPKALKSIEIKGRQGIIYERVNGPSMLKLSTARPWMLFHFARQLAELHTEIHKNKVNGLPSQRNALAGVIQQLKSLSPDIKASVLKLLDELPDGNTLCHFDFHPDQVLITNNGPVIIDWMTAQQGHPHSDVARTCIILKFGQVPYGSWAMRRIINMWRGIFYQTYIRHYLVLNPGVSKEKIINWMIPVAAGRLDEAIPDECEPILRFIQSYLLIQ